MKWLLHTTDVPIRKVIQHTYPRIRDHELVMKPKTIPLEQTQLPEIHYSTVYPPLITWIQDCLQALLEPTPSTKRKQKNCLMNYFNRIKKPPHQPPQPHLQPLMTYQNVWLNG